jgi:aspartate oxidase
MAIAAMACKSIGIVCCHLEVDDSGESGEEIEADQYDDINDINKNKNSRTGKTLKSACKSIAALQQLADQVQTSREFRECCQECSTVVSAVRLALFQAMTKSRGVHM